MAHRHPTLLLHAGGAPALSLALLAGALCAAVPSAPTARSG